MIRLLYTFLGVSIGFVLTLYIISSYDVKEAMFQVANTSYKTGCFEKRNDCEKASNDYEFHLRFFIDGNDRLRRKNSNRGH